jgi:hypothetical protein
MDLRRKKNEAAKAASKGELKMAQLFVFVNLSKAAALRAGETHAGFIALPVTSAMIMALSQEETGVLERHVGETGGSGIARLDVDGTDDRSIKSALAAAVATAAAAVAAEAEKTAADEARLAEPVDGHIVMDAGCQYWSPRGYDLAGPCYSRSYNRAQAECNARNTALRDAEKAAHAEKARIAALDAAEKEAQFTALVSALLSDEQRERFEVGCLPVKERDTVTRNHLFFAFGDFAGYEKMTVEDISHSDGCYAEEANFDVDEDVELANADLDADQFAAWKRIAAVVAAHENEPELELRCHEGKCKHCDEEVRRYGAKVTIYLALHSYSREFAL